MLRKLRACSAGIVPRSCHGVGAADGGDLRRNRAAPASVGEQWLAEGIASGAGSPSIGRIGSLQISSLKLVSPCQESVGCVCCFKTGCCFVVDASLFSQRLRNSFKAAETFQLGTLFLRRPYNFSFNHDCFCCSLDPVVGSSFPGDRHRHLDGCQEGQGHELC